MQFVNMTLCLYAPTQKKWRLIRAIGKHLLGTAVRRNLKCKYSKAIWHGSDLSAEFVRTKAYTQDRCHLNSFIPCYDSVCQLLFIISARRKPGRRSCIWSCVSVCACAVVCICLQLISQTTWTHQPNIFCAYLWLGSRTSHGCSDSHGCGFWKKHSKTRFLLNI